METTDNAPQFTGEFTPEFQRLFKQKRVQLGFSCTGLGRLLGVSCSIISRWEHGKSRHCSREYIPLVADFLVGTLDAKLLQMRQKLTQSSKLSYPPEAQKLAQKIVSTYQLLSDNPEQKKQFLKKLDAILKKHR